MKISGLQKMTLLDYPGKVACTVFLGGCNLRCPFCHNSELFSGEIPVLMEDTEFLTWLEKRRGILDAVCVSGGEPTLHPGLKDFICAIKDMGYLVKLDTNGCRPDVLKELAGAGLLDYVAMDIKNDRERYTVTSGLDRMDLGAVEESIRFLLSGGVDYEFRTTVVEPLHDLESFRAIARWLTSLASQVKARRYFLQPFADRDTVLFSGLRAPAEAQLQAFAAALAPAAEVVEVRGV